MGLKFMLSCRMPRTSRLSAAFLWHPESSCLWHPTYFNSRSATCSVIPSPWWSSTRRHPERRSPSCWGRTSTCAVSPSEKQTSLTWLVPFLAVIYASMKDHTWTRSYKEGTQHYKPIKGALKVTWLWGANGEPLIIRLAIRYSENFSIRSGPRSLE